LHAFLCPLSICFSVGQPTVSALSLWFSPMSCGILKWSGQWGPGVSVNEKLFKEAPRPSIWVIGHLGHLGPPLKALKALLESNHPSRPAVALFVTCCDSCCSRFTRPSMAWCAFTKWWTCLKRAKIGLRPQRARPSLNINTKHHRNISRPPIKTCPVH
jgi:hypothetical protein